MRTLPEALRGEEEAVGALEDFDLAVAEDDFEAERAARRASLAASLSWAAVGGGLA